MQLGAVLGREAHVGEHPSTSSGHAVWLGLIHQQLGPELFGDAAPLRAGLLDIVLDKGCCDESRDDTTATPAGVRHGVAHEVD